MVTFKDRIKKAFPVFKDMLSKSEPIVVQTVINGGTAGSHTVADIKEHDELVGVVYVASAAGSMADLKSEFIVGNGKITNTGGTNTTSGFLIITYLNWDAD